MRPAGEYFEYHHGENADYYLSNHDTLDPLTTRFRHSGVKNTCILRSRTARPAAYLHHLVSFGDFSN